MECRIRPKWHCKLVHFALAVFSLYRQVWQQIVSEHSDSVEVNNVELAQELTIPWKHFVLFVCIDLVPLRRSRETETRLPLGGGWSGHSGADKDSLERLRQNMSNVEQKVRRGNQVQFFFDSRAQILLDRLVVVFTDQMTV